MADCPATSPWSGRPCHLPDHAEFHFAGHESAVNDGVKVSWATKPEEYERWAELRRV